MRTQREIEAMHGLYVDALDSDCSNYNEAVEAALAWVLGRNTLDTPDVD